MANEHCEQDRKLTREGVKCRLEELRASVRHDECWTCDCLQGFITQLELDACEDVSDLTDALKVPRSKLHGCLGCDPCPPGAAFSDYIRDGTRCS